MSFVSISGLYHSYDHHKQVLHGVSFDVEEGQFVSLLGPSGCGKTTILRLIAGFDPVSEGTIEVDGQRINDVPAHKRNMGMVFQSYALFPHMSVIDNVEYGLRQRGQSKSVARAAATAALQLVQLDDMGDRAVTQLSGGQQQRVALARAIVIRPKLLLLDESLSALDRRLRIEMQIELRRIQQEVGITTIFVTHDQEEALTLSDRVALLSEGRVEQYAPPVEIYERPCSAFVASFLGHTNLIDGTVETVADGQTVVRVADRGCVVIGAGLGLVVGAHCSIGVRPEKIQLGNQQSAETPNRGSVGVVSYAGGATQYTIQGPGTDWAVQRQNSSTMGPGLTVGDEVWFGWPAESTLQFPPTT